MEEPAFASYGAAVFARAKTGIGRMWRFEMQGPESEIFPTRNSECGIPKATSVRVRSEAFVDHSTAVRRLFALARADHQKPHPYGRAPELSWFVVVP